MSGKPPDTGPVHRLALLLALAGGLVLLAVALLTTVSVMRRWLAGQPLPGDFELVSLGAGLAVMGCLAWGTMRRSNILVDSFTTWLPGAAARAIDAAWMLVWAAVAAVLAERLWVGAAETWRSGTTTMVLGLPTFWAVGLAALCFAVTALAALIQGWRLLRGHAG